MAGTISIREWQHEISVPRDHPAPARVRDQIVTLTAQAAQALGEGLDSYIERKADEVIFIRELVFDCDIDTGADPRQAALALATRCAHDLVQSVESGSPNVVRFASRATYVARFAEDVANGSAWGAWYYAGFDGLRALPTPAAIRTVLVEDAVVGRAALAAIKPAAWPALAQVLGDDEAVRVLDELCGDVADAVSFGVGPWSHVLDDGLRSVPSASVAVTALHLLACALRAGAAGGPMDGAAARVVAAVVVLSRGAAAHALDALVGGDPRGLALAHRSLVAELAVHFGGRLGATLRSLAQQAREALQAPVDGTGQAPARATLDAPFAGLGLLLDEIDHLLDTRFTLALPRLAGAPARETAALTVIALTAGGRRGRLVWHDAAWRDFLELPPVLRWEVYTPAFADCPAEAAHAALAETARGHQHGEPIDASFRSGGIPVGCSADSVTGLWLAVFAGGQTDRGLFSAGCLPGADTRCEAPDVVTPASGSGSPFRRRLAAARRARADWIALSSDPLLEDLPLAWRRVFVWCAQIAWRRLAQRVPGMTGASISYLREHLVGTGGLATPLDDGRWRWRLRRPPLHVLLDLAGISRGPQVWRGPPERRIEWDFGT